MMGVNGLIQSPDLQFQSSQLIDDGLQRLFHGQRKGFAIILIRDDRGKLRETFASRLRNEPELGKMSSERIGQLRAMADKKIPRAMQHQQGLLIGRLDRHEPHRWACHGLTVSIGIGMGPLIGIQKGPL